MSGFHFIVLTLLLVISVSEMIRASLLGKSLSHYEAFKLEGAENLRKEYRFTLRLAITYFFLLLIALPLDGLALVGLSCVCLPLFMWSMCRWRTVFESLGTFLKANIG
jgi:isoprenylcysteine carboxyl methyltransferase (ICMT) family protein YpbQ